MEGRDTKLYGLFSHSLDAVAPKAVELRVRVSRLLETTELTIFKQLVKIFLELPS